MNNEAYTCDYCKKSICVGDDIVEVGNECFHPICIEHYIAKKIRKVEERERF